MALLKLRNKCVLVYPRHFKNILPAVKSKIKHSIFEISRIKISKSEYKEGISTIRLEN